MYQIGSVTRIGDGAWLVSIDNPEGSPIHATRHKPGATEEEIWTQLQDKCDALNVASGMVSVTRGWRATDEYRRRCTISYKARRG